MFSRFDTIPACDRQTDVQPIAKTCFSIAADARKNNRRININLLSHHGVTQQTNIERLLGIKAGIP